MADDEIEIGEDVDVAVVVDDDGNPVATVIDDLVVTTGPEGSVVDETIELIDSEGRVLLEDEVVSVYDEDGQLIAESEQITEME